jgi:hypothetical protein
MIEEADELFLLGRNEFQLVNVVEHESFGPLKLRASLMLLLVC